MNSILLNDAKLTALATKDSVPKITQGWPSFSAVEVKGKVPISFDWKRGRPIMNRTVGIKLRKIVLGQRQEKMHVM